LAVSLARRTENEENMSLIEKYKIEIFTDETYKVGSADNINKYDSEYLEAENKRNSTFVGVKYTKIKNY
jgi:hypothetical protein